MIKWFDRKFDFQNLSGTLPMILERLSGTPLRLRQKIKAIPPELWTVRWESQWSIQEQVGHLGDLESLWENRLGNFIKGQAYLDEADLSNQATYEANHNQRNMQTLLDDFGRSRKTICTTLETFGDKAEQWQSRHHRLDQPMRPIDLAYFVAEHDDHHLAYITYLYQQLDK